MITAAGIMFVAPNGNCLLLKRSDKGDMPGYWCFPGGKQEGNETLEECAAREAKEECGSIPKGDRKPWTRSISAPQAAADPIPAPAPLATPESPPEPATAPLVAALPATELVDFQTFLQQVDDEFMVKLDGEHVGWCWAPLNNPPQPLHPGCQIAIDRLTMNEVGVAQAIADGRLTSPQHYDNVWLFALRITGTGVAYRHKHKEFVWRDPALYMNPDFLARCNGLPVIMEHPKKGFLNSKEFSDRIIGTVVLPYLDSPKQEVWGVAKIYDDDGATMMQDEQLSTSPCVVFRDPSVNNTVELEDGSKLLIEGAPSLVDHLAVCYNGVWDKGGDPVGVLNHELVAADDAPMNPFYHPNLGRAFELLSIHADSARLRCDSVTRADAGLTSSDLSTLASKFRGTTECPYKQIGERKIKEAKQLLESNPEQAHSCYEEARAKLPYAEEMTKRKSSRSDAGRKSNKQIEGESALRSLRDMQQMVEENRAHNGNNDANATIKYHAHDIRRWMSSVKDAGIDVPDYFKRNAAFIG